MPIQRVDPDGLMKPQGYTHVVVASGARTVYLAGQGTYDAQGNLVGEGDHQAQTRQAVTNLLIALKAAGATPDDLVKLTLAAFLRGMREATEDAPLPPAASTLVGVERLAWDPMLIEIEAVAVTS
jgi:enamine deaminase RidA (YjgF/YER057c/UK114 family)